MALIQHSAASGKSNSIAWLAHQLIGLTKDDALVFDSIIVTDRRILDQQIKETIKQFAQMGATVGHVDRSGDLRKFIADGTKIIISTVQSFHSSSTRSAAADASPLSSTKPIRARAGARRQRSRLRCRSPG